MRRSKYKFVLYALIFICVWYKIDINVLGIGIYIDTYVQVLL